MGLRKLGLPPLVATSTSDLLSAFYVPALSESVSYDRGVGFFSSAWIRLAAEGLLGLAKNGGVARLVASPILDKDDWEALRKGSLAREDPRLFRSLERSLDELRHDLNADTRNAISWMVADGMLEFRLALPSASLDGDFHDKFGVFRDAEGDVVAFHGSPNDSQQAFRNYESIDIYCSWHGEREDARVRAHAERFERIWGDREPNLRVFSLPDAIRSNLVQLRLDSPRPYKRPVSLASRGPSIPLTLRLRDYQNSAVDEWFRAKGRGVFEMATGAGKTITALSAAAALYRQEARLAIVIAAPYRHLVDQWHGEAASFGFRPILAYESRQSWESELNTQVGEYSIRVRNVLAVITTHATLLSQPFQDAIRRLRGPVLFVADEVHHLGAPSSRSALPAGANFRLGLSATPDRWLDSPGTQAIYDYFGKVVFRFTLKDAIREGRLCPYEYRPEIVALSPDELDGYKALTAQIARAWYGSNEDAEDDFLRHLLIKRSKILNNAVEKIDVLERLIGRIGSPTHTLVYCEPEQIDQVVARLGQLGLLACRFTAEEPLPERRQILEDFTEGRIQVVVAMRCLDEGLDVPATTIAIILASSSNPRQFIQRRGRVLRPSPGKERATIYDLITIPPLPEATDELELERRIIRREIERFKEFASCAVNEFEAREKLLPVIERFGVLSL